MKKPLYINFNQEGKIESWSKYKRPHHLALNNIPKDFKGNEDNYEILIEDNELSGIKPREDIKTWLLYKDYLNTINYVFEENPIEYDVWLLNN